MEIFLLFIAVLSIVLLVATLFTPFVETHVDTFSTVPMNVSSPEFITAIESITRNPMFALDHEVEILNNGDEFFPDFEREIRNAKQSITVANYIWDNGEVTDKIMSLLAEKAQEGIEVRVLMDGLGQLDLPKSKIDILKASGAKVEIFRPLRLRTFTRTFRRTHLRAFVIDGRVGYIGGFAFKDTWRGDGITEDAWRDVMFKVQGQAARETQDLFSALWRETDGEILSGEKFYPADIRTVLQTTGEPSFTTMLHQPSPDLDKSLSQLLWLSFAGAEKHIHIETPYLMPDANLLKILKEKARSGIEVEIIVPGKHIDSKSIQAASRSYYVELMDAGVHIFEYEPALFHNKVFTVDGKWSVIGSANLDNRSSSLNVEGLMIVDDTKLAQNIEKQFEIDKSRSVEVNKEVFKQNFLARLIGRFSRLFVKQY